MRSQRIALALTSVLLVVAGRSHAGGPLGTAFTYQGQLKDGGLPADGFADFQFTLLDSSNAVIGGPLARNSVEVIHGLFTVGLDFGILPFDGSQRRLRVAVRFPAGAGVFTVLAPLQEITPVPYALKVPGVDGHSLDASDGSPIDVVFVNTAGSVGVGTTAPARKLEVVDVQAIARLTTSNSPNGSVLELRNNTAAPAFLGAINFLNSAGGAPGQIAYGGTDNALSFRTNSVERVRISEVGFVGINRASAVTGADFFAVRATTGPVGFGGMYVDTSSATGKPFYGYAANGVQRGYTYIDAATGNWHVNVNAVDRLSVQSDGSVKAERYTYSAPKPHIMAVPAEAFHPTNGDVPFNTRVVAKIEVGFGDLVASVNLPHGAQVTGMRFHFSDDFSPDNLLCELRSRPLGGAGFNETIMAQIVSQGEPGNTSMFTSSIVDGGVDNLARAYFLRLRTEDGDWPEFAPQFYGLSVVITYTTQEAD